MSDELQVLAFLALMAAFGVGGLGIVRRFLWGERPSEDALRAFLVAVGLAVLLGTALGLAGLFRPVPAGIAAGVVGLLGIVLLVRSPRPYHAPAPPLTPAARAVLCLGLGTVLAHIVLFWPVPTLLTDALTYHLTFPARWLQEGRIVRVPAAFHAGAHAYFPVNQEVLSLWWMLPFHSEVFARFVQVPFLLAAALAVYVLTTTRGLSRDAGAALAGAFLLFRPFLGQAIGGPYNDVTLAALLLGALHACDGVRDDRSRGAWVFGIALGLFLGTKFVAVPFSLPLIAAFLIARPGWRAPFAAMVPAVLLGGTWYAWNWMQTGDPVYPGDLAIGGVTLAEGLYAPGIFEKHRTMQAFLATVTGSNPFSLTPLLAGALGVMWLLSHGRRKGSFTASTAPVLLVLLYVLLVPLEDSRYLMPAFAALAVSAGAASTLLGARWSLMAPVVLAAIAYRESMEGTQGVQQPCLIFAGAIFVLWTVGRRLLPIPSRAILGACAGALLVAMGAAPFAVDLYHAVAYGSAPLYEGTNGDEGRAWTWLHEATREAPAKIAYAGTGQAFPLFGERLGNRVVYIPVREGPERLVHEYRERITKPLPNPLERSAEIVRSPPDRVAWMDRIEEYGVKYLLVVGTEQNGQPLLERTWADSAPDLFHVELRVGGTTIYRIGR
ncbi:MAG: hypothetical protein AAB434_01240 [Planctomycetota bacterium]